MPTSDKDYEQEVPGYANPVTVRIFDKEFWGSIEPEHEIRRIFRVMAEEGGKVYTVGFWQEVPEDWQEKWSEEMKNGILESFKLI